MDPQPTGSIVGVAIASALYAVVSLVCTLALLRITGHRASELSTAERDNGEPDAQAEPRSTIGQTNPA